MPNSANSSKPFYIIVGLSGAGKSTALRVFEDHRFFAVDGLPVSVAPEVAAIMESGAMAHFSGLAIGLDIRVNDFLNQFKEACEAFDKSGKEPRIIFLEADEQSLVHRYAATRRPHPLENEKEGLESAIRAERQLLQAIRSRAWLVINSSGMSVHDLRRRLQREIRESDSGKLRITLISFGFKNGIPQDADFVFDLRFLPNPFFVETLRDKSGLETDVAEYVFASGTSLDYATRIEKLLSLVLPAMETEGRYRVNLAFGCTGGRHRSVAFAEKIAAALVRLDFPLSITHRDIDKDKEKSK